MKACAAQAEGVFMFSARRFTGGSARFATAAVLAVVLIPSAVADAR
jgi:hypothetical protein